MLHTKPIVTLTFLIALLACTACVDFLKETSQDEMIPTSTQDFIELLNGEGYIGANESFMQALNLVDDDVRSNVPPNVSYTNPQISAQYAPLFTWQPDWFQQIEGGRGFNSWTVLYKYIAGTNIALQYADLSVGSESEKNYLKGQAYALRAFYYFLLVNLYGLPYNYPDSAPENNPGVPIVLSSDYIESLQERQSVAAVYERITEDLDQAIRLLEIEKKRTTVYRINDLTAHFIAARVYLYMGDWDKAIAHASIVLQEKNALADLNTWNPISVSTNPVISASNPETIFMYGSVVNHIVVGTEYVYPLSDELIGSFEHGDLRADVYMLPYSQADVSNYGFTYRSGKRRSTNSSVAAGSAFRTAELYLNRAEAAIERFRTSGNMADVNMALGDLNRLRKARMAAASYTEWTYSDIDDLSAKCRAERRRELFAEHHRWFDLRRYGMPAIKHVLYRESVTEAYAYVLQEKDPAYVFPIPEDVMERNTALIQNPQPSIREGERL